MRRFVRFFDRGEKTIVVLGLLLTAIALTANLRSQLFVLALNLTLGLMSGIVGLVLLKLYPHSTAADWRTRLKENVCSSVGLFKYLAFIAVLLVLWYAVLLPRELIGPLAADQIRPESQADRWYRIGVPTVYLFFAWFATIFIFTVHPIQATFRVFERSRKTSPALTFTLLAAPVCAAALMTWWTGNLADVVAPFVTGSAFTDRAKEQRSRARMRERLFFVDAGKPPTPCANREADCFLLSVQNKTGAAVVGFKGMVVLRNRYQDVIARIVVTEQELMNLGQWISRGTGTIRVVLDDKQVSSVLEGTDDCGLADARTYFQPLAIVYPNEVVERIDVTGD